MASNTQRQRGYANIDMPSRNEESKSSSFQDDIGTLNSMIQRGAAQNEQSSSVVQRGTDSTHHFDRQRWEVSNSQPDQQRGNVPNQQIWRRDNESSPRGHPNPQQWTNQTSFLQPLPPNVFEQSPIQQFTHHCSICNVSCNHEIAYRQHLAGKKHLKKAALLPGGVASLNSGVSPASAIATQSSHFAAQIPGAFPHTNIMPGLTPQQTADTTQHFNSNGMTGEAAHQPKRKQVKQSNEPNDDTHQQYYCAVCDVTCNHESGYRQHLEGKRHKKQVTRIGSNGVVTGNEGRIPPVHNTPQPSHIAPPAAPVIAVDPRINPPPALAPQHFPTDPILNTIAVAASSINQQLLVTDPRKQTAQTQEVEMPATGIDSEEEGEIDEAEEDIEHLYNDFEEPDSTGTIGTNQKHELCNGTNDSNADPDIDEMFGEDDVILNADKTQADVDSDIDEMFGENDQDSANVIRSHKNEIVDSSPNQEPDENDADEKDMFGESSDEEGEENAHSIHNTTSSSESKKDNQRDEDEIEMFGLEDEEDNGKTTKHVSFCDPPVAGSEVELSSSVPLTPSEALAAARRRASIPKKTEFGVKSLLKKMTPTTQQITSIETRSSGLVQKEAKPKSLLKKTAPATKIRKTDTTSIASSKQKISADTPKRSYYQQVHPDRFWSTLRHWDFIRDLNDAMKKGKQDQTKEGKNVSNAGKKRSLDEAISENNSSTKILPDKFDSVAQYQALWAPLLIEETKAQLLSEVVSAQSAPATAWMNRSRLVMGVAAKVELSRSARDLSFDDGNGSKHTSIEPTVVLHVRPTTNGAGIGCPVSPNDLILFVQESSILELGLRGMAFKNNDDSSSILSALGAGKISNGRLGFVGHALNHRSRSVDGLLVRASQTLWGHFSSLDELFVIRIGSNVTALREFNALLRLDEVPLSKYLLDGDFAGEQESYKTTESKESKFDPLSKSGLPVGFRIFIKSKMNTSQLQAITASSKEYGSGGFTLIKGPPGTGKSTTLVSILNALHLRQYQEYYSGIERIVTESEASTYYEELALLNKANEVKPRILVCAPSNAATDNVVAKIMCDRFVDGNGSKYSPSIVRVGAGIVSDTAKKVGLQELVNSIIQQGADTLNLETIVETGRRKLKSLLKEIQKLKLRIQSIVDACPYEICEDWEIRIMEEQNNTFGFRILFVNHKSKTTTFDIPPKRRPTEKACCVKQLPHYVALLKSLTKYVERHNNESSSLEQYIILQNHANAKREREKGDTTSSSLYQELETHLLNSSHIVLTTLGSAGSRAVEAARKFEVIVIDEAAQSSEMNTLLALQLGSSHAILVGDPQQLPATIFSMSGRSNKYDRSLFQRLEQCKHPVVMLNIQYRMHPIISEFPRYIFYKGMLMDGSNTKSPSFGGELKDRITKQFPYFKPVTILDLNSKEEREGTGLSNMHEAQLALHLYISLDRQSDGSVSKNRVAVITPYAQQTQLLHRLFEDAFGASYSNRVEISTVDAFQGREAGIVIYSCVRAGGKGSGIGFLSDVQRMNVALTRAQHFLFIIARRRSIMINPYWRKLISYSREKKSLIHVPINQQARGPKLNIQFPDLAQLVPVCNLDGYSSSSDYSA